MTRRVKQPRHRMTGADREAIRVQAIGYLLVTPFVVAWSRSYNACKLLRIEE